MKTKGAPYTQDDSKKSQHPWRRHSPQFYSPKNIKKYKQSKHYEGDKG